MDECALCSVYAEIRAERPDDGQRARGLGSVELQKRSVEDADVDILSIACRGEDGVSVGEPRRLDPYVSVFADLLTKLRIQELVRSDTPWLSDVHAVLASA